MIAKYLEILFRKSIFVIMRNSKEYTVFIHFYFKITMFYFIFSALIVTWQAFNIVVCCSSIKQKSLIYFIYYSTPFTTSNEKIIFDSLRHLTLFELCTVRICIRWLKRSWVIFPKNKASLNHRQYALTLWNFH